MSRSMPMAAEAPWSRSTASSNLPSAAHARGLHLFVAALQALLLLLGRRMKGALPTHMYEWTGQAYRLAAIIPAGVL